MELVVLLLIGLLVGLISTVFGVGGGMIAVPILYMLFPKFTPQTIIASSLAMIWLNSMINLKNFAKRKKVIPLGQGIVLITGAGGGAIASTLFMNAIPNYWPKIVLSIVLIIMGIKNFLPEKKKQSQSDIEIPSPKFGTLLVIGLSGGLLAGITGLGGGAIMIPLFILWLQLPYAWLSVYSNCAMIGTGAFATLTHFLGEKPLNDWSALLNQFQIGNVNVAVTIVLVVGASISSYWGTLLSSKISPHHAKKAYGLLLLVLGIRLLIKTLNN